MAFPAVLSFKNLMPTLAALLLCALARLQDDPARQARELVEKLRSERVEDRDQAVEDLKKLGTAISSTLKVALGQERDSEVRSRLEYVLQSFIARKVCDGSHPVPSPSGKALACVRWVQDPDQFDLRGNRVWSSEAWIRDRESNRERRLARGDRALGWRDEKTILLGTGTFVDAGTGKAVSQGARLPPGLRTKNVRWSPDGEQLVSVPDRMFYRVNSQLKPPVDVDGGLCWIDGKGGARVLALGHTIDSDCSGFLSWSPDGKRLAFDLLFFLRGQLPLRRIGVVEFAAGTTVFVGTAAGGHQNWGHWRAERSGYAQDLWDGKGERFVFITGRGKGEAEVSIAKADGSDVVRLTDDGQCKWCPVLDPAGRRVAFAAARWGGEDESLLGGHIRVLDLLTGQEERFQPQSTGECSTLTWSPDGTRLFYDWSEEGSPSTLYEAALTPAVKMPEDAPLVGKKPGSRKEEVLKALGSENAAVLVWGIEAARDMKSPEVIAALRTALDERLGKGRSDSVREILMTLVALDVREAVPQVMQALELKDEATQCRAILVIDQWKVEGAKDRLLRIVKETPEKRPAVYAASALASLGHGGAWEELRRYAGSKSKETRGDVASLLGGIPDGRSVEILISLVADRERLYWDYTGEVQVGDHAEHALAVLTGETFSRDAARWAAWWKQKDGKLPELKGPNKALEALRREAERKGEQRQRELREAPKK